MKERLKEYTGITLISLVITIIVLLILAGVSIAMLTGENGILTQAQKAKEETEKARKEEENILSSYEDYINNATDGGWNEEKEVNVPKLVQGMKKIMFTLPTTDAKGSAIEEGQEGFDENNWYDYKTSKWANTMTEDGSMWVWIPRFAYKITYKTENKSDGGTIDVKFLIGTTDQYYDEEGNLQTAKRAKSATEEVDTTSDYYVHPAFTDESDINYANGGWNSELTGIWVAKFEAGYASKNNLSPVVASNVNYSQTEVLASTSETGTDSEENISARNCLDGVYGSTTTAIKYPTFQPITYSMNYISIGDAYNISRVLTDNGNIYGLSSLSTDSHLMKNSEWGAVAYLSWSQYGTKGQELCINSINVNNNIQSVYAVTGLTTGTTNAEVKIISAEDITSINIRSGNTANNGIYAWDQLIGQKASSTLNMYGVYDLSGGLYERTTGYINNEDENLSTYGASVIIGGNTSTKYATVYPYQNPENSNLDTASGNNYTYYKNNGNMYGDAIGEISTSGTGNHSWNDDDSYFPALSTLFTNHGGCCWNSSNAGLFAFGRTYGDSHYLNGFRPVLVAL